MTRTATRSDPYMELVSAFRLRPIRTRVEYDQAAEMLDRLVGGDDLTEGERDYLDALTLLVEAYDREHFPAAVTDPLDLLKALMEHRGMTTTALGAVIGSKGVASEVLNGKRPLSKSQLFKLGEHFGVDPAVFLPLTRAKA